MSNRTEVGFQSTLVCVCVCTVMYKHKMRLVTWDIEAVQAGSWLNWWSDVLHQRLLYRYVSPVLHTLHGDSTCLIVLQNNGLKIIAQQLLFVQNWKEQEPQLRSNGLHLYWFHFLVFEWSKSSFGGCFREKGGKNTGEKLLHIKWIQYNEAVIHLRWWKWQ